MKPTTLIVKEIEGKTGLVYQIRDGTEFVVARSLPENVDLFALKSILDEFYSAIHTQH